MARMVPAGTVDHGSAEQTQAAAAIAVEPGTRLLVFRQAMPERELVIAYTESREGSTVAGAELVFSAEPPGFARGDVYAFAAPIVPGKTGRWLEFAHEISGPRRADLIEQRKRLGLKETIFLQRDSRGDLVIPVIEGERPWEEDQRIAESTHPFDRWFIDNIVELHGIDFSAPPPPRNELLLEWPARA